MLAGGSERQWYDDFIIYRYADCLLLMAEAKALLGQDITEEINAVRKRAYGANWDENVYGYTAGTFLENEVAILREKDKEFIQEGQRWWDLLRMTYTKGGDALVFHKEASVDGEKPQKKNLEN